MSFAVSLDGGRFEYASSYAGYFAQRRNVVRPAFLRMTRDILRFNRLAPRLLAKAENLAFTIGDFIVDAGLSDAFRDHYLLPMASCICWRPFDGDLNSSLPRSTQEAKSPPPTTTGSPS